MGSLSARMARCGLSAAVLAVACLATLWLGYALHWGWVAAMDSAAQNLFVNYGVKHPAWIRFWDVLCTVFGPGTFRLAGAGIIVIAVARHNLRVILFVLTTIGMSGVLTQIAKNLADRPRPAGALAAAASSSFPSGHAVAVMAAVLALLTITSGLLGRRGRMLSVLLGVVVVVAVGLGRVILNVHYASDVVAGWALGYLWYLCCLLVIRPLSFAKAAAPDVEPIGESADETPQVPGTGR